MDTTLKSVKRIVTLEYRMTPLQEILQLRAICLQTTLRVQVKILQRCHPIQNYLKMKHYFYTYFLLKLGFLITDAHQFYVTHCNQSFRHIVQYDDRVMSLHTVYDNHCQ